MSWDSFPVENKRYSQIFHQASEPGTAAKDSLQCPRRLDNFNQNIFQVFQKLVLCLGSYALCLAANLINLLHLETSDRLQDDLIGNKQCICLVHRFKQCLGSGSVGSARFWLPGSGYAKIFGSTDPDPRGKISTKNCKKKILISKPKSELLKKRFALLKNFSKFLRNNLDLDPDPFFSSADPGSGSGSASKLVGS